jgi:hypothetical protein
MGLGTPFGVFFVVEGENATVLAVTHRQRDPASRQGRRLSAYPSICAQSQMHAGSVARDIDP